ncbi:PepSY-associated TM helix domain-containing protein [Lichenicoccus roseus]|uniref:PepSY domain-containing protein n=1 Tax=Lichenicoccus roseus TaxID=2683649 RepID=A0A5R9J6G3_9PROT|nr:PepSY-associated TM helix domain-containing protein [Lichenicoccus roseus]TLU72559.1 PepSY domain-containing protein [Lichenicoccus roseus]
MTMRRLLFVSHRYLGLAAAIFLLIAATTGCLLVFRAGLDAALNPELFRVPSRPVQPPLALVRFEQRAHPDWHVAGFPLRTAPGEAFCIHLAPAGPDAHDQIFVDPADGAVVGARTSAAGLGRRNLFQAIYLLHYTLLAGTPGRWLMGVAALAWLLLALLGICITWPRRPPWWRTWAPAWRSTGPALARRPLPELHRVGGLWLLGPLAILAYTSVAMNFYDEAFRPIVETLSPPRPSPFDRPAASLPAAGPAIGFARAEQAAVAAASRRTPGLAPVEIADDPARGFYEVGFAPGGSTLYEGFGRVTYSIDRRDGDVAWIDQPRLDGAGRLVLRSLYPLHSGQVFGLPTRLLVLLLGLATTGLAVTGFLPWWRRLRGRRPAAAARANERPTPTQGDC